MLCRCILLVSFSLFANLPRAPHFANRSILEPSKALKSCTLFSWSLIFLNSVFESGRLFAWRWNTYDTLSWSYFWTFDVGQTQMLPDKPEITRPKRKKAKTKIRQWKHCGILHMLLLPKSTGEKRVRIIADLLGSIAKRKSNQAISVFLSWCSRPSFGVDQGRLYVFLCKRGDQREAIQISKTGKTRHCTDEKNFLVSATQLNFGFNAHYLQCLLK